MEKLRIFINNFAAKLLIIRNLDTLLFMFFLILQVSLFFILSDKVDTKIILLKNQIRGSFTTSFNEKYIKEEGKTTSKIYLQDLDDYCNKK